MGIITLIIIGGFIYLIYTKGMVGCLRYLILAFLALLFIGTLFTLFNKDEPQPKIVDDTTIQIDNEYLADIDDIYQAKRFLRNLPPACSETKASAKKDGSIHIDLFCKGNGKMTTGTFVIKDGIVTEVK